MSPGSCRSSMSERRLSASIQAVASASDPKPSANWITSPGRSIATLKPSRSPEGTRYFASVMTFTLGRVRPISSSHRLSRSFTVLSARAMAACVLGFCCSVKRVKSFARRAVTVDGCSGGWGVDGCSMPPG